MKVKLMRERLHEAIDLANEERIIATFRSIPLEISRSKYLSLLQIRELVKDAEEEFSGSSSEEDMEEVLKSAHRTFFAVLRKKSGASETPAT
ncbi:hypothetical protein GFS24_28510 [Chitinophaga sp. SYP-B3965]|uniref:hypothetical protein n=1 Tax=Chitinophaga sp. SYP-B3965 TaxID=2663120 RepID=UPI0012997276|nr:hypothetical protein [Chitinophaga sp. SYP-B3965]MRG49086.1 hypothetical protein [Chitinophaga sp. SYP-B3965]